MKVLLLLVVAVLAVAHARRYSAEERYQPAESRRQLAVPAAALYRARAADDDDDDDNDGDSGDASDWQQSPTTEEPCPDACKLVYDPVCVRDDDGVYRKFSNNCFLQKCRCDTNFRYKIVSMRKCQGNDLPECPRPSRSYGRARPEEDLDVADSDSSASD
uniref:Greglin n=4 Tax=cellular organisms TaxID=131567 RepID=A0A1B1MRN4_LOCMI|nr:greglin [Locusta migratoria]